MGLLDQVIGAVSGATGQSSNGGNPLLTAIMQMVNNPQSGGLAGMIQSFQNGGLAEVASSWVSTGQNLPVSTEQIQNVINSDQIQSIANQFGISTDQVSGHLAEYLPQIIDKLTPNGDVPENSDLMAQGLELLKGKIFG